MNRICKIIVLGMSVNVATLAAAEGAFFPAAAYSASGHTLSFDGKTGFRVTSDQDQSVLVEGVYSVSDNKLSLTDQRGSYACPEKSAKGSYQWAVTDEGLKLTKLVDACDERSSELTAQVWRKN